MSSVLEETLIYMGTANNPNCGIILILIEIVDTTL